MRTSAVGTIEVVAHRGSSETVAEHTLAAFEQAIADGADSLECDVRLTADGYVVCVHDRRIDRTSDGRGVVSTKTLAELDARDFGSWKPPVGAELVGDRLVIDESRRRVLTLERLLDLVVTSGRDVGLAIEAKHPTRYAGLVEQRIVEVLRRFGLASPHRRTSSPVRVMSFSQLSVRRMRALAPRLPTVFLMDRVPLRFRDGTLPFDAAIAGPSIDIVRAHPGYVARAHGHGHPVHVWTVDDDADVRMCQDLGVDAIITNRPAAVLAGLGRSATAPRDPTP
jgi:glycerophosphoryl diester phosphodiesterase